MNTFKWGFVKVLIKLEIYSYFFDEYKIYNLNIFMVDFRISYSPRVTSPSQLKYAINRSQ